MQTMNWITSNESFCNTRISSNRERDELHFGKSSFQTVLDSKVMFIYLWIILILVLILFYMNLNIKK